MTDFGPLALGQKQSSNRSIASIILICSSNQPIVWWPQALHQALKSLLYSIRPLTAKLRWRPFSSVPHVSDRLELHNNWASWILHPGPSGSDVYSDVMQEAQSNNLLHTVRLLMSLDTPLHGNNARGAKYAVYYASVATHTVFENIKWLLSELCWIRNVAVPSLACLFPDSILGRKTQISDPILAN